MRLENNVRLYVGGKHVEVAHFGRAHTDGDGVAYFPDHRVVATGDMFTVGDGLPPLVDYPGEAARVNGRDRSTVRWQSCVEVTG